MYLWSKRIAMILALGLIAIPEPVSTALGFLIVAFIGVMARRRHQRVLRRFRPMLTDFLESSRRMSRDMGQKAEHAVAAARTCKQPVHPGIAHARGTPSSAVVRRALRALDGYTATSAVSERTAPWRGVRCRSVSEHSGAHTVAGTSPRRLANARLSRGRSGALWGVPIQTHFRLMLLKMSPRECLSAR